MSYFTFFFLFAYLVLENSIYSITQFGPAPFQGLRGHLWLVVTPPPLDSTGWREFPEWGAGDRPESAAGNSWKEKARVSIGGGDTGGSDQATLRDRFVDVSAEWSRL